MPISIEALSGISGSISISCWIVVFTPQILENFRRGSAEGLSLLFVIVWLLGDVFNILGAVLQGVIPTMTILAVYYTFADFVLLGQCLWYRRGKGKGKVAGEGERESLLGQNSEVRAETGGREGYGAVEGRVRRLLDEHTEAHQVDGTHLSPATPFVSTTEPASLATPAPSKRRSVLSATVFNIFAIILVSLAGVLGWFLTTRSLRSSSPPRAIPASTYSPSFSVLSPSKPPSDETQVYFDPWGQFFGWLCAVLYLVSRIPQLLLNYRRKSTDGVSILFFLFACVGNLTYVMSIFAYQPVCARVGGDVGLEPLSVGGFETLATVGGGCVNGEWRREYWRYILLNASWLAGSGGTLLLDLGIFVQFWLYRDREAGTGETGDSQ